MCLKKRVSSKERKPPGCIAFPRRNRFRQNGKGQYLRGTQTIESSWGSSWESADGYTAFTCTLSNLADHAGYAGKQCECVCSGSNTIYIRVPPRWNEYSFTTLVLKKRTSEPAYARRVHHHDLNIEHNPYISKSKLLLPKCRIGLDISIWGWCKAHLQKHARHN